MVPSPASPLLRLLHVIGAGVLTLSAAACGSAPAPVASPASVAALWQQIEAEVGTAGCDHAQQCHTIAIGAKACGGPERYLAWSSKDNDGARLRQLTASHLAASKKENRDTGLLSNCSMVSDPGATCQAGRCIPLPRGLGGAAAQ